MEHTGDGESVAATPRPGPEVDPDVAVVRRAAARQAGRLHFQQLAPVGQRWRTWLRAGLLVRTRPRVFALGPVRTDPLALGWEAVLFAGPGAYLTGASAAHHLGLIDRQPNEIIVATPRHVRSVPGIRVLPSRPAERHIAADGLPVASPAELLLQLAADTADLTTVRFALSNLDYRGALDLAGVHGACRSGRSGSALLRQALGRHLPELARCRSPLEVDFLVLLDAHHRVLPLMNRRLHGILVDAWWPQLQLVVELDGGANHSSAAQRRRDASSGQRLRSRGLGVLRLDWDDVHAGAAGTLARLADAGVVDVRGRPHAIPTSAPGVAAEPQGA